MRIQQLSILLVSIAILSCDAEPVESKPATTSITVVEQVRSGGGTIIGCCECMTADLVTFWPECHSHLCEEQCVTGEQVHECEWIDAELVCPLFECP